VGPAELPHYQVRLPEDWFDAERIVPEEENANISDTPWLCASD
jgi:hypothetical protein